MELNMKVTFAGYKYCGHYRRGYLEIVLEGSGCGVTIHPSREFDLVDLFSVFDIGCEDPTPLNTLQGKYCRACFDESDNVVQLRHLVSDNICWKVKGATSLPQLSQNSWNVVNITGHPNNSGEYLVSCRGSDMELMDNEFSLFYNHHTMSWQYSRIDETKIEHMMIVAWSPIIPYLEET